MSLFGKEKTAEAELINSNNHIAKGTSITGDVETHGNIRIDGNVKGNIQSKAKVVLGPSAKVEGNIYSVSAEVEGEVSGKVMIKDTLLLRATSNIGGDINTNKLIIEAGAKFNGNCKMGEKINFDAEGLDGKKEAAPKKAKASAE